MAEVTQVMAFECDLNHAVQTQPLPNVLVKGDKGAHEVRVTVMRGDTPVSVDGATVTGTGIMGMNVAIATGKAAGNVASFVLNEGFYAQHGEITLLLTVMLDGVETTVFRGVGNVLPSGSGKTVIDPGDVLGWGELQNAAKEATKAAANANAAAGEANAAATNANDKANAAEVATASVNAAKDKAETAATNANREAAAAKTATQNANNAASKATLAAGDAEKQAAAANKATTAATQAAQSAQGAVQDAGAAIGELNAVVADVQHKLDTGAFVGAQGEKGERGEQGIQGIPGKDGAPGKDAPQIDDSTMTATNPWSSLHTVDMLCPPLDATGNPVVCYPIAGYPLGVKASWMPKQEGAGEPSPENIRPIVGRDTVQVARCGKNLLDLSQAGKSGYNREPIPNCLEPGVTYTYKVDDSGGFAYALFAFDSADRNQQVGLTRYIKTGVQQTFVAPANIREYNILVLAGGANGAGDYDAKASLVVGAESSNSYQPYTGTTATLALPHTIYGGEVDAVTGQGAETWGFVTLDGTGATHIFSNIFYINIGDNPRPVQGEQSGICSHGAYGVYISGKYGVTNDGRSCTYVPNGDYPITDEGLAQWQTFLQQQYAAGTPVTIAYKLAAPVPFTATGGAPLPALAGTNTVLTDGDTVQVTGRGDIGHALVALAGRSAALENAIIKP